MCGIAGYFLYDKKNGKYIDIQAVRNSIHHRGPDGYGEYLDTSNGIGFVHTRLSIIDLSKEGHQPMISNDGSVIIIFNGEIYNYIDLKKDLEIKGYNFRGHSDTEVLLQLYISYRSKSDGIDKMLKKLNGIFAFAVWDKYLNEMILVRDAIGVKPLYYTTNDDGFFFSSEMKAFRFFNKKNDYESTTFGSIDHIALDRYLTYLWCPGDKTPASWLKKLQPGEILRIKKGEIKEKKSWYTLPAFRMNSSSFNFKNIPNFQDAIEITREKLRAAVERQLVSDVPVGAFLSGGLDSSSIITFARNRLPDIKCFTIDSTGTQSEGNADDLPYAMKVASHLGVKLDVVNIEPKKMAADIPTMVLQLDEPLADPASLNVLYICRHAKECGIKVLLSGAGGDDLFAGYRRHYALTLEHWWNWLPYNIRVFLEMFSRRLGVEKPFLRRIRKLFSNASLSGDERLVSYFTWIDRKDLLSLYTKEFKLALGDSKVTDPMMDFVSGLPNQIGPLEKMLALEQRFFLADHNLTYTDKMSMAVGVEVRVPFLDLDLVEYASTLPKHYKLKGREGKWILKKAMEPYLPRDVIYRPKTGFGVPLRQWLRFELKEWLYDILSEKRLIKRGLFEPKAVHRLIKANTDGKIDASYTLFSLACIEVWCQHYIDYDENNKIIK